MRNKRSAKWLTIAVVLAVLSLTVWNVMDERRFSKGSDTQLWFFDVGQGDAMLIRSSEGETILIDGGPDGSVLEGLATALPWWQRQIDVVMVTHLDADHYVGLFGVLERYEVGELWWNGVLPTSATGRKFIRSVQEKGISEKVVSRGDRFEFDEGQSFEIFFPFDSLRGSVPATTKKDGSGGMNDTSVVGRFVCGDEQALLTGDISFRVEGKLVDAGLPLDSELLKLAHHGSAHSSSEKFLDAVRPEYAVVSAGAGNRYGHPAPRVTAALLERGIKISRTDKESDILFVCDGEHFEKARANRWWKL